MKKHFITGVCGTIGEALLRRILEIKPGDQIVGVDVDENRLSKLSVAYPNVKLLFCDIRNEKNLVQLSQGAHFFYHLAALKHVNVCENTPSEAIMTNVSGVENALFAAQTNRIKKFLFTSSDKSVNPTNVMGITKALGEKLVLNASRFNSYCSYYTLRFGNVLGSSGSLLEIIDRCIDENWVVELTDARMTRYIMSKSDAANLILDTINSECSGSIVVPLMNAVWVKDLIRCYFEQKSGTQFRDANNMREVGARPGEKLYEELCSEYEIPFSSCRDGHLLIDTSRKPKENMDVSNSMVNSSIGDKLVDAEVRELLSKAFG